MSRIIPDKTVDKIQYFEAHNAPWTANSGPIGLVSGDMTTMNSRTAAARAALNTQIAAQNSAKAATEALNNAVNSMVDWGSDLIKKIKTKAATDGDNVYVLAQIPAPATPTPVGAPGKPFEFVVTLNEDGSMDLKWKCNNPAGAGGTSYQVFRQVGGTGDFLFLGATGLKAFSDISVPSGVASITYKIIAWRSTAMGAAAEFTVKFGVSGGTMTASVVAPRMAA